MAANLVPPLKDGPVGEFYEVPVTVGSDGLAAAGFYPQATTATAATANQNVGFEQDVNGNGVLKDPLAGSSLLIALLRGAVIDATDDTVIVRDANNRLQTVTRYRTTAHASADKIEDATITRDVNGLITKIVVVQYSTTGITQRTLTGTVARSVSGRISGITWLVT